MIHGSGAGLAEARGALPGVLRLLPYVHLPPARVLVPGAGEGHEARALDARGYRVTALAGPPDLPGRAEDLLDTDFYGVFDLVCERGYWAALAPSHRDGYVAAVARALRPGGQLFGVFPLPGEGPPHGVSASELLYRFAPHFDAVRIDPGAFPFGPSERPVHEVVLVRR